MAVLALSGEESVLKISTDCGVTEEQIFVIIATVLRRQSVAQKILFMNRIAESFAAERVRAMSITVGIIFFCVVIAALYGCFWKLY